MAIFRVGIVRVEVILGGNCPGVSYPGWEFSLEEVFRVGVFLVPYPHLMQTIQLILIRIT